MPLRRRAIGVIAASENASPRLRVSRRRGFRVVAGRTFNDRWRTAV